MKLTIENTINHEFISSKLGEDYHSMIYRVIFYILCFSSIKLILLITSPAFYQRLLHKLFNLRITLFRSSITIYFLLILWIVFLFIFLGGKFN